MVGKSIQIPAQTVTILSTTTQWRATHLFYRLNLTRKQSRTIATIWWRKNLHWKWMRFRLQLPLLLMETQALIQASTMVTTFLRTSNTPKMIGITELNCFSKIMRNALCLTRWFLTSSNSNILAVSTLHTICSKTLKSKSSLLLKVSRNNPTQETVLLKKSSNNSKSLLTSSSKAWKVVFSWYVNA